MKKTKFIEVDGQKVNLQPEEDISEETLLELSNNKEEGEE